MLGNTPGSPPDSPHSRTAPQLLQPPRAVDAVDQSVYDKDAQPYKLLLLPSSERLLVATRKWHAVLAFDLSSLRRTRFHVSASGERLNDAADGPSAKSNEQLQTLPAHAPPPMPTSTPTPAPRNAASNIDDRRAREAAVVASGTLVLEDVLVGGWAARPDWDTPTCATANTSVERAARLAPERPDYLAINAPSGSSNYNSNVKKSACEMRAPRELVYLYDLLNQTLNLYEFTC